MGIEITDMTAAASVDGTEIIPTSKADAPRRITPAQIYTYIRDTLEAIAAGGSVASGNGVFMLQSGVMQPVDIDVVLQRALDTMWGKAAEASPADADKLPLYDVSASQEQTITLTVLAEYVRAKIEAAILDISDLASGSGTLATTDYMLVTQGTTAKRITVQNLYDAIYTGLAAHVAAKTSLPDNGADSDVVYIVRSGTGYKVALSALAAYFQAESNPIDGSGTADFLAQWSDTNTLQAGPAVVDSSTPFGAGTDEAVPTTAAVRDALNDLVYDQTEIGAALVDADTVLVNDGDTNTTQKKSLMSRFWTYVLAKITALTSLAGFGFFLDEDAMTSDSATKVPSQQSVKAYVDATVGGNVALTRLLVNGATDIGADLADGDEVPVYDLSATVNRKSALSRFWTYVLAKIVAITDVSTHGWVLDEDGFASNSATKVPTQQSVKAYVDAAVIGGGVYKTLWIPAGAMVPSTTAGATPNTIEYGTNDMTHDVMTFPGATADSFAEFDVVMPEGWNRGTIKAKTYWTNGHADANAGEHVRFYLAAGARSNDDPLDAALGTLQNMDDQHIADDDVHVTAASSDLTVGGTPALGDLIHFKLGRDYDYAGGGSAMDVNAHVLGVLIQYLDSEAVVAW